MILKPMLIILNHEYKTNLQKKELDISKSNVLTKIAPKIVDSVAAPLDST